MSIQFPVEERNRQKKKYLIKEGRKDHQAIKYFYGLDTRRRLHGHKKDFSHSLLKISFKVTI